MSELRRASTSHSSVSSVVEFESFTETLLKQIRDAVDSTVKDVPLEEGLARCFLARSDLDSILHSRPLEQLFRDIRTKRTPATPRRHIQDASEGERGGDINIDATIDRYIAMTTGIHSRTALLAMLIYQDREELLTLFLEWLDDYADAKGPSDDSIPFTIADLLQYRVPKKLCRSIIQNQAIFRPITIRQSQHRDFQTTDRLPFVGARTDIKNGSSGTVFHTTIAPRHWEIKSGDSYVSGNPTQPMVIALKTFREIPGFRDMQETTYDFEIERDILKELRSSNVTHNMIMLDWGSFTVIDDHGHPTSHSLIFELATFSLADFLRDDRRAKLYKTKSLLLKKLVDVVEALACLHDTFKTMHLDIKPDNILVFEKGSSHSDIHNEDQGGLIWKLSDFGLARKFGTNQRSGHNTVDSGDQPSRSSATLATRPAGVYQAPEIQERNSSQAGRGSDVWSIGCVALMIMAFVCGDPSEVFKLTNCLPVDFMGGGGCQNLFYVRNDSRPW
ncbi:kinase-like protein, partial [Pyrenochaeta sp. DS3sAY3a]